MRNPGRTTMASADTHAEIEEHFGQVPSWMGVISDPAADHSWGIMRDLLLGETELSDREKALVGLGAAAAIECPYCVYFHREEAKLADVTDSELTETVNVAGTTKYFSTMLHGARFDEERFVEETDDIMEHIKEQQTAAAGDD